MTTPEALRDRQIKILKELRFAGICIVIIALGTAYGYYDGIQRANDQRQCLESTVRELTAALQVRADLAEDDTAADNDLLLGVGTLVLDPSGNETQVERDFRELFETYQERQAEVAQARKETPIPEYPPGRCDG